MRKDPYFGFDVPDMCSGVPSHILDPRQTWDDPEAYDRQAAALVQKFKDNFTQFAAMVSPEVAAAGPG
jgi:phosphoenolpyruvate carboxykinase (ATP)